MGGKSGSTSTSIDIPQWQEDASKNNLAMADQLAQIGYTPYYGPDVAAFTDQQMAGMQGYNDMAAAFGMPTAEISMPEATDFGGGLMGYSSSGLYESALSKLQQKNPEQYSLLQPGAFGTSSQQATASAGTSAPEKTGILLLDQMAGNGWKGM